VLEALVGTADRAPEVLNRIQVSGEVAGNARVALERMLSAKPPVSIEA